MKSSKVLIAIPCLLLGGTEYQTLNLVKALSENDYSVKVLCYFEYDERMVGYMHEAGAEVLLMTQNGTRPTKFLSKLFLLLKGFNKVLRTYQPDIVHVQYMAPGALAILLFKLLGAKKVLATAHVPGHIYKNKFIPKFIAQYMTDLFLSVSKSSEKAFFQTDAQLFTRKLFNEGRKHFTIYNCIEYDKNYVKMLKKNSEPFTIGIVSRLSFEKGIDIMLHAMVELLKVYPQLQLLIIGDGEMRKELLDLSKELNISDAITWKGLQAKDKLKNFYEQMDIVVIPSRFEGFGLTAIEALSLEIPVVASAVDGLKEVIVDNESGVLFPCEDSDALSNTILKLIKDNEKRESIAIHGKKRVSENFSYEIYKERVNELYTTLQGETN